MYIYELSEGEYEYVDERLISHKNQYSQDEFKNIVIGAINYNKKHLNCCKRNNNIEDIVDTLKTIYGFEEYKIPIQASVYDKWMLSTGLK